MAFVQQFYSHEFRSPPVPLVALVGCPELHKPISEFFLHALKPPLVSLCCNEPVEHFVPRAFSTPGECVGWPANDEDLGLQRAVPAAVGT